MAIVGSGLPRLLVVCSGHDGRAQVEWLHAPGACCEHEHGHAVAPSFDQAGTGDEDVLTADPHCEHHEFAAELGAPPKAGQPAAAAAAEAWLPPATAVAVLPSTLRRGLPQATGPPRPDGLLRLRATTLLLL
jgi:hypothetical protein